MLLHFADDMHAGEGTAISDCQELQQAIHDELVHDMLLNMWDGDAHAPCGGESIAKTDRKMQNRLSAQLARAADKEYVSLLLKELESLTETFELHAAYITQLKMHAADPVDSTLSLEQAHAQNKRKIAMLQQGDVATPAPTLLEMPRKERNRIHAQNSRQRKHQFLQDLIKQRDDSWSTVQDAMRYTTTLESACSVLHNFDDTGYILLQLTETRQRLLMRTGAHKQKYEELLSRSSYRKMCREKK